jgi:hypothetical protein
VGYSFELRKTGLLTRCVEMKKAERRLKQAKGTGTSEKEDGPKVSVEEAELDLAYVMYYPYEAKYDGLWTKAEGKGGSESRSKGNTVIRERIKKAMVGGKARLEELRDELTVYEIKFADMIAKDGAAKDEDAKKDAKKHDDEEDEGGASFFTSA